MASLRDHIFSLCPTWVCDDRVTELVARSLRLSYHGVFPKELFEYLATCLPKTDAIVDRWTILSIDSLLEELWNSEPTCSVLKLGFFTIAASGDVYTVGEDGRVYYCDVGFATDCNLDAFREQAKREKSYDSIRDFMSGLLAGNEVLFD